jgi:hypothetical protein
MKDIKNDFTEEFEAIVKSRVNDSIADIEKAYEQIKKSLVNLKS